MVKDGELWKKMDAEKIKDLLIKQGEEINTLMEENKRLKKEVNTLDIKTTGKVSITVHEKPYCYNCKHLEHDGGCGIWCGVRGNNKDYNCPKYERKK